MMKLKKWLESLRDDAVKSLCNDAKLRGGFGVSLYEISMYVIIYKYMFCSNSRV